MTDAVRASAHLEALRAALADLRRYAQSIPKQSVERDRDAYHMVRDALYLAVQACIDLAQQRIAELGLRRPADFRDTFRVLADAGQVPGALASGMQDWAGFRNVLAHVYTKLDLDRLHEKRTCDLEQLEELAAVAAAWVTEDAPP
ncbi:MAG: DUF86 domain-containing protein [Deltaproteobacteria bacterium]|nr:DUF86 domain-containing protein [Deltaproteobacteria bacterium]